MDERGRLFDLIYQTVLEPQRWVAVMERIADSVGGRSGCLTRISVEDGKAEAMLARIDPVWLAHYHDYYSRLNLFTVMPRPREFMAGWAPRVTTELDYLPRDELASNEYYNDFMLRAGVGSALMISLDSVDLDVCALNIQRSDKCEPFGCEEKSFAQSLHPHLIRAFRLGETFRDLFALGESQAAALDRMAHGLVIVDSKSRIRHANVAAEDLLRARKGLDVADGRLTATQPAAARKLEVLIAAATDAESRRGGSIKLPSGGHGTLSVTVVPLAARALPTFTNGPAALVTIAGAQPDEEVVRQKLEELFALTSAEARVALALLAGMTPRDAAQRFDVSVNTIRSQMAAIFGKTGTSGQAELSRLMVRLAGLP